MTKSKQESRNDYPPQDIRKSAANTLLSASQSAANAINSMTKDVVLDEEGTTGADYKTMVDILESENRAVSEGDLQCVEAMLLSQSHILQSVFMIYTQKMSSAEYTDHVEAFSRIALKAQNQCRQTLATLGELKNPKRATFIKQQNNAVNQQINQNGEKEEISKIPDDSTNELLEEIPHEQLDTRATQASCRVDQEVETVGEVDRTENSRR